MPNPTQARYCNSCGLDHPSWIHTSKGCAHCGNTENIMGIGAGGWYLCHGNPDGTKADPDCYHLVTVCGENIGSRLTASR